MTRLAVTVTSLEMLEPPAQAEELSFPPGTRIVRANPPSLSFYRFLYNAVGGPWMWYERNALSDDALAHEVQDGRVEVHVLYRNGDPAGYAELDRRIENNVELAYFGLRQAYMGQGLGWKLLRWAIAEAWCSQPSRVWVHTCTLDAPAALGLYKKAGFLPFREEAIEIDYPPEVRPGR
ncbi:MAG: GNAT family N-acetyltransferase [Armatimonadetes bacterium]|nr:GNAT family N-acetyltransferase [Armatimonadota bacterium]MDE2206737.1 GNAT family N-acetyltransferase [Armatimonadota bacterium]